MKLLVNYGQDAMTGRWGCPLLRAWELGPHQKITPGYAEKLCFTVTATGSYEEAAQVASKWAQSIDDSTLHALVQRIGQRAEQKAQSRYASPPQERLPQRAASELAVLMTDGCQIRYRGVGWGKKNTKQNRVEWHELKLGVFYRHEEAAHTESGRGLLADKIVVSCQEQALELGRRLNWEALREGLGRARQMLFLGDGADWVSEPQEGPVESGAWTSGLLPQQPALGRALQGESQPMLSGSVEPLRHQMRHGKKKFVLRKIAHLKRRPGHIGKIIRREQNYFENHSVRMNYQEIAARGWPIGSGAVESARRQKQCRFKRCGQFWTAAGLRSLCALDEARRNHHWDELWTSN